MTTLNKMEKVINNNDLLLFIVSHYINTTKCQQIVRRYYKIQETLNPRPEEKPDYNIVGTQSVFLSNNPLIYKNEQ